MFVFGRFLQQMNNTNIKYLNDSELWNNFRNGEEAAFAHIFHAHYQSILSYGRKFHKDSEFVEDCIQELFLELWKNKKNLSPVDNIKPYLLTSIRRKIIKQLGKVSKFKQLFSKELSNEYAFEVVFSQEAILIQSQIDQEQIEKIQKMLVKLPARQKEVLYLLFYQDMSYEEIGKIMSMNYQSARNLVHRAIKLMRAQGLLEM
jgi:RNA polymerase sigma factor (sigma-70 family)